MWMLKSAANLLRLVCCHHVWGKRGTARAEWRHTHQVLFTQSPELLEFLRHQELSTSDCAANFAQHCRERERERKKKEDRFSSASPDCVVF